MLPGFRGPPFHFDIENALGHLGYLNGLLGWPWANPVYWSLAIEFQYYLLSGLLFPLLATRQPGLFAIVATTLVTLALLFPKRELVFAYLPLFAVGFIGFRWRILRQFEFLDIVPLIVALVALVTLHGWPVAGCVVATALVMTFTPNNLIKWQARLGLISYSLYLVHVPVGGRVVNFASRFVIGPWSELAASVCGLVASCLAAVGFYLLIERPARRWASRISIKPAAQPNP